MVQTVSTYRMLAGEKRIVLGKPHILSRIFFYVGRVERLDSWHELRVSFDDPQFLSYFSIAAAENYFSASGSDIFQGDIWVLNASVVDILCTTTEILH